MIPCFFLFICGIVWYDKQEIRLEDTSGMKKTIYLAGGCFWGCQKYFDRLPGVLETEVGYANGRTEAPTYEQVKHENTGHAETVRVVYDDETLSLRDLLAAYGKVIDPTVKDRQGEDVGHQYRTGIYFETDEDGAVARDFLAELGRQYEKPILVEAEKLTQFFPAEEYHQKYLEKNPGGYCHIHFDD